MHVNVCYWLRGACAAVLPERVDFGNAVRKRFNAYLHKQQLLRVGGDSSMERVVERAWNVLNWEHVPGLSC